MNGRVSDTLRRLHAVDLPDAARDGDLLSRFVRQRDSAAFEQIVRRHGPMVLGVCRRVLGNAHDADDAFQATFLVLARRAGSIVPREMIGNWLYGVAYRSALEARRMAARRTAREVHLAEIPVPLIESDEAGPELSAVLDHELSRLPDRLRLPVVLCDLEGRTRREVARQLGVPAGTLSNRLTAARRILARRLANRGVTLPAMGLAMFFAQTGRTAVPSSLLETAIGTVLGPSGSDTIHALTHEVVKAMYLTKLKACTAIVVVVGTLAGVGAWGGMVAMAEPTAGQNKPTPTTPKAPPAPAVNLKERLARSAEEMKAAPATGDDALRRKADRLMRLAYLRADHDKAGAAATFQDALTAATQIKDEWGRAESMKSIASYQVDSGLLDDARKTSEKIVLKSEVQTQDYRGQIQTQIAGALARGGDVAEAVKVAEAIPERVNRYKDKDGKEVERRDVMQRDEALKRIVEIQLKRDDAAGAAKTVARLKGESNRVWTVQQVILGLAKAGDTAGARKLFDELKAELDKSESYSHQRVTIIVVMQVAIGDVDEVLAGIDKLKSAEERADALAAVPIGLSYRAKSKPAGK